MDKNNIYIGLDLCISIEVNVNNMYMWLSRIMWWLVWLF